MTATRASAVPLTLGVALSTTELVAAGERGAAARRFTIDPPELDAARWPSLTDALRELAGATGTAGGTLDVALLPPLAEVRALELPPMRDDDVRLLLARNAGRYFVGARGAQVVGARRVGGTSLVIAAATAQRLVATLQSAAREAGWRVRAIVPAEGAWGAGAAAAMGAGQKAPSHLIVCDDDRTLVCGLAQGQITSLRRFRAGAEDAALVLEALGGGASSLTLAIGAGAPRDALVAALSAAGRRVAVPLGTLRDRFDDPAALAASFAGSGAMPRIESEESIASARAADRRMIGRLFAAAAALLVVSAAVELWGAHRQLDAVRAERAALRPRLATTLVGRSTVESAYQQLNALAAAERTAPHWAALIGDVAERLDDQAYLTAWRARDDSLVVDGVAERASRAFDSLVRVPGLTAVRAAAPVRREAPNGGAAKERFTIAASVAGVTPMPVMKPATPAAPATPKGTP